MDIRTALYSPMSIFKTIGLITKRGDEHYAKTLRTLLTHLRRHDVQILVDDTANASLKGEAGEEVSLETMAERCDLVIVVGGDGSLLHAARALAEAEVPLLGINLGRLGFLVDISPLEMATRLDEILAGEFTEAPRFLMQAQIKRGNKVIGESYAMNDVVLHIHEVVRMIEFQTYIDGQFVNTQRADGLIVSTPTGSTAYALSGGGPILHPSLNALVLVPICPHTLSHRPIVVCGDSEIEIVFCGHNTEAAQVSFDGQANIMLEPDDRILIRRKPGEQRLLHPKGHDYFHILRAKLRWGEQP